MGRELCIIDEETGTIFAWNRAHTVNVRADHSPHADVDVYSIGDFAQDAATLEAFEASVEEYLHRAKMERYDAS